MAPAENYDVVMAHGILHLVGDMDAVIVMLHRLPKLGGIFVASKEFLASINGAGFEIDYEWRPEKGVAVFFVAQKAN